MSQDKRCWFPDISLIDVMIAVAVIGILFAEPIERALT
jgi:hypothetical protein